MKSKTHDVIETITSKNRYFFISMLFIVAVVGQLFNFAVMAQSVYNPYMAGFNLPEGDEGKGADWVPLGMYQGWQTGSLQFRNVDHNADYSSPTVNRVVILPSLDVGQSNPITDIQIKYPHWTGLASKVLPLTYKQATSFLPFNWHDLNNVENLPLNMQSLFGQFSEKPNWRDPEWARNYVVKVAMALTDKKYSGTNNSSPFIRELNGVQVQGMDCSNFVGFVYNYALGIRAWNNADRQGGQIVVGNINYTPNYIGYAGLEGSRNEMLADVNSHNTMGKLLCDDGTVSTEEGCGSANYLSGFDIDAKDYNMTVEEFNQKVRPHLKPGDLLFLDYWDNNRRINHVVMWTGIANSTEPNNESEWYIIHSIDTSSESRRVNGFPRAEVKIVESLTGLQRLWGVRRIITDDGVNYLNTHYKSRPDKIEVTQVADAPSTTVKAVNNIGHQVKVYPDNNNIMLQYSLNDGETLSQPLRINPNNGNHGKPDVAIDEVGNVIVVWQQDLDLDGYYNIGIGTIDLRQTIPTVINYPIVNRVVLGQQLDPAVTIRSIDEESKAVVTWSDDSNYDGYYNIFAAYLKLDSGGWSYHFNHLVMHEVWYGQQIDSDVAMNDKGDFIITWEDDLNYDGNYSIFYRGFKRESGTPLYGSKNASSDYLHSRDPVLTIDDNGEFWLKWVEPVTEKTIYKKFNLETGDVSYL